MIIDCHAHLFYDEEKNERFVKQSRRAGVDKLCAYLSGGCSDGWVADDPNRTVIELRERWGDMIIPFVRVHADDGQAALDELDRCVLERGFRGLKLSFKVKATDPAIFPVVEKTIELRVPILFHAYMNRERLPERPVRNPEESSASEVAELARRYPEARIVMTHYSLGDWEYGLKVLRDVPNVFPSVSGSSADSGATEMGVAVVGASRVIFGTDNCIHAALGKVLGADISEKEKRMILGENMLGLLQMRGPMP